MSTATETLPLVGLREIADMIGVHAETVRRMETEGVLPDAVLPRSFRARWRRVDIERWLGLVSK